MDSDRFHRAAKEGHLDLIQEANRKDLNTRDDDGMTPAMWAAYYGHLDALRLVIGRGGDPDKCDYYGNTPLHCAAGNGHVDCVSFLVNFGVNLWALDNDFHTAKDVAVLSQRNEVLRLLDQAESKHALLNKKLVQRLKEKSVFDAEKRLKRYRKLQLKSPKKHQDKREAPAPKFSDLVHEGNHKKKKSVVFRTSTVIEERRNSSDVPSSDDSDVLQTADSGIGDELAPSDAGLFERPGFGTVTLRNVALPEPRKPEDSIGSAGSLFRRHISWQDEDDDESEPVLTFLTAVGLAEYNALFQAEKIDLESLSLLSEEDLKALGMPLGPRRKLGKALQQRLEILKDPGIVHDSRL